MIVVPSVEVVAGHTYVPDLLVSVHTTNCEFFSKAAPMYKAALENAGY